MRKFIAALVFLCVVAANCFAPELKTGISWLNDYAKCFPDTVPPRDPSKIRTSSVFSRPIERDIRVRFAILNEDADIVDTVLEWALASYYSPAVVQIRPKEADAILPANNPKLADQKLGAAVFQEIQILRFLGDTAAVNRHEAVLQFITGRGNATRAEIEKFYRDNVRSLIAAVVDEEFNKISFLLENYSTNSRFSYNVVLIRNPQNGQYILSYERPSVDNDDKTLSAPSLEALSSAMRNSGDFVPTAIDTVRAQAALIPAEVLNNVALDDVKTILTAFYTNPNVATYNAVRDVYAVYRSSYITSRNDLFRIIRDSYGNTLEILNLALSQKVKNEAERTPVTVLSTEQQRRLVQLR